MRFFRFIIAALLFCVMLAAFVPLLLLTLLPVSYFLVYRIIYKVMQPEILEWKNIIAFDAEIGWKPKPNLNAVYLDSIGDKCSIITDSEGWAGRLPIKEADIIVIGDSFAFGYGATYKKSYAFVDPEIKIKPIAAPGYNMVQELLLIKKYAAQLQGKNIAWFICLENDLYDNLRPYHSSSYSTPFVKKTKRDCNWQLIKDHVSKNAEGAFMNHQRQYLDFYDKLGSRNALSDRAFSAARYIVDTTARICAEKDISLHVVGIPYKDHIGKVKGSILSNGQQDFDEDYIDVQFNEICDANDIPYHSLRNWLTISDYKKYDSHWNEIGNKKVSEFLKSIAGDPKENLTINH